MAAKKVGDLIKEARAKAGLTQEQLAKQVDNVTAADIGRAERGEKALTQAALKQIAKATGVTQKSLLEAPAGASAAKKTTAAKTTAAKTSAAKTSTAKTGAAKTTAAKTSAAKTSTAKTSAAKTSTARKTASTTALKLTAAEKRIVELYRKADADKIGRAHV